MTRDQVIFLGQAVKAHLPIPAAKRLKAIHMTRRQNEAMLTIRCFFTAVSNDDPEDYVINTEEI
jgi:hypothetical protein